MKAVWEKMAPESSASNCRAQKKQKSVANGFLPLIWTPYLPSSIFLFFFFVKLTPSSLFDLSRKHSVRSSEITSTSDAGAGIIAVLQRL